MLDSFKAALARVQSDYEFYIGCQTDPASTLAGYDLSPEERSALTDPDELGPGAQTRTCVRATSRRSRSRSPDDTTGSTARRRRSSRIRRPVVHEVAAIKAARLRRGAHARPRSD